MLLLKDARLLQFSPPELREGLDVLIEGNRVARVGRNLAAEFPKVRTIELGGNLLSPGIVCSHNHFYSALASSYPSRVGFSLTKV